MKPRPPSSSGFHDGRSARELRRSGEFSSTPIAASLHAEAAEFNRLFLDRNGNREAICLLFVRVARRVDLGPACDEHLREDCIGDAVVRAIEQMDRGGIRDPYNFFCRVIWRQAIDSLGRWRGVKSHHPTRFTLRCPLELSALKIAA